MNYQKHSASLNGHVAGTQRGLFDREPPQAKRMHPRIESLTDVKIPTRSNRGSRSSRAVFRCLAP
jgi:hypothetical protein